MTDKLNLDPALVAQARELARRAGEPVTELARTHTTVSVERAVPAWTARARTGCRG
jgi:beta-lysine 5,6-aminomutase alpha subunit